MYWLYLMILTNQCKEIFLPYSELYLMWEFTKENLISVNNMFSNVFVQSIHFREENIIINYLCVWVLFIDHGTKKERVVENCLDIREQLYAFYLSIDKLKKINCDTNDEGTERENVGVIDGSLLNDKHTKSRFEIYKENRIKNERR